MTVTNPISSVTADANGVNRTWNYNFLIPYKSDGVTPAVLISVINPSANTVAGYAPESATFIASTAYTITGLLNPSGGTVTFPLGIITPLIAPLQLNISRSTALVQPFSVSNQGFFPNVVEQLGDWLEYQIQEIANSLTSGVFPYVQVIGGGSGSYFAGTGLNLSSFTFSVLYGTSAGTAAQGNDSRLVGALQAANNLADVANPATAQTNLGLASAATLAFTTDTTLSGSSNTLIPTENAVKTYIDNHVIGAHWLSTPCACATTGNITLSGEQTIDGVSTSASRVLVKNQTSGVNNGVYVSGSGAWTRATDNNSSGNIFLSAVFVSGGTTQGNTQWVNNNASAPIIGTTVITFAQIGAATSYTAGTGLGLAGTVFSVLYGTTSGTAIQGNDSRITGAAQKASNLSDLASASTSRTNLGLGTAAVATTGTTGHVIPFMDGVNNWGGQTLSGTAGQQSFLLNGDYTDATTNYVVIASIPPGDGIVSPRTQTMLQIVGTPNPSVSPEVNILLGQSYNGFSSVTLERYDRGGPNNGAVLNAEPIGVLAFSPYDGVSDAVTAGMSAITTEDQVHNTNHGTSLAFFTTPNANGSSPSRVTGLSISPGGLGGVTIGAPSGGDMGAGTLNVQGSIYVNGTPFNQTISPSGDTTGATDTAALAAAVAVANSKISGVPGATYYLNGGVRPAANVFIEDFKFCLVVGTGGFASKEVTTNRYATSHVAINWSGVDGGGYDNLEFYGSLSPAAGGEYCVMPIAVNGGMTTRPFIGGRIFIHDLALVTGGIVTNSIGAARCFLGSPLIMNCGTFKTGSWWTAGGTGVTSIGAAGIVSDGDLIGGVISSRGSMGRPMCVNIFQGPAPFALYGDQTSFIVLGGVGANTNGWDIEYIDADSVAQPLDLQQSNCVIGGISQKNCAIGAKAGHGAQNNIIGPIHTENTGFWAFSLYGTTSPSRDTAFNRIGPINGTGAGELPMLTGTLASATSTTVVLPSGASTVDSFYLSGNPANDPTINIISGTGVSQERVITAYVGSTKTATVTPAWTITPDNTSVFAIYPTQNRSTVAIFGDTATGRVLDNEVLIGQVVNLGQRKNDVYGGLTQAGSVNNVVTMERDMGGTTSTINMNGSAYGSIRLLPASSHASTSLLVLTSDQSFTSTYPTPSTAILQFNNVAGDSYLVPGVTNPQVSLSEYGFRVKTPGPKRFVVSTAFGSGVGGVPQSYDITDVQLFRNGSAVEEAVLMQQVGILDSGAGPGIVFDVYHKETWFGGNQNLYQVQVGYTSNSGTRTAKIAAGRGTYFSVSG